ncbi:Zinc transporter zip3 [Plakobranchus ocellatus]|uniref:Zinc transporter zip3 n=1 Tax=Plakobranchus ocellatus TaxID=259542 RepID=A0AAV3Y0M1_9GAST|nr:Zinc transporter zip3 [Plakobranchus ocellatus]
MMVVSSLQAKLHNIFLSLVDHFSNHEFGVEEPLAVQLVEMIAHSYVILRLCKWWKTAPPASYPQRTQQQANGIQQDGSIQWFIIQFLSVRVKSLMSQLVEESTSRSWSELRLKRIEMGKLLCNKLFMEQENIQTVNNTLEKLDLAQQVMRIGKETSDLQKKLDEKNALNFKLKNENGELLGKLKESREKSVLSPEVTRNRDYKRLKNELDIHSQSIIIYKNIIQRLVVGLGIHLDEDEELQELVEKCGEILTL